MNKSLLLCATLVTALAGACGDDGTPLADATPPIDGREAVDWAALPDVPGGPIQEIAVAELDGKIYVVGGFNAQLGIVANVRVYDVASGEWSDAAPVPMPVHHGNLAATGGKLYLLGALEGISFQQLGTSWVYDPATDAWSEVAAMDPAQARGSAAVGVIDGTVYLAGGLRNGAAVAQVSAYDPVADSWDHSLAPLPEPRDHLVGAAVGGTFYAVSGRDGSIAALTDRVDAYDPGTDTWTERAPIPTRRGGTAAGVVDGRIIVVGGEGSALPSGVFPEVESYDPTTDTWTSLEPMRTPRHGMGAAGYDGKLYVPGGATVQGFGAVATFEVFTPAGS